jgi:DNA repair exonuclease SbcCD nuclease subunit
MVSFLHAADLHLGMRITRFDQRSAQKVREARFTALDNVIALARNARPDFLLIAGDLFDDHAVDLDVARRCLLMLEESPKPVFVLPGNHDPLLSGGVWDRPPWNAIGTRQVHLLRRPEALEAVPGVQLFPCPVLRKTSLDDPCRWIAQARVEGSMIRIGVAHGSLKIREDLPADDHLIGADTARELHLDYLALGHWHSQRTYQGSDGVVRTAYAGVHEPMRFLGKGAARTGWVPYSGGDRDEFLDDGRGQVLLVRIDSPGAAPVIEPHEVGHLSWAEEARQIRCEEDLSRLIREVATRPSLERRLLRLKLTGVLDADAMLRLGELREILEGRLLHGELDDAGLHLQPTEEQMREVAGQGVLGKILERLRTEADSADPRTAQVAERGMLLLYQIAREAKS